MFTIVVVYWTIDGVQGMEARSPALGDGLGLSEAETARRWDPSHCGVTK